MTGFSIAAHREGARVAIETLVDDPDYRGVASTSYLDAEAAIRFGEALVAMGREIKRDGVLLLFPPATKEMPLALPSDPHAGDKT